MLSQSAATVRSSVKLSTFSLHALLRIAPCRTVYRHVALDEATSHPSMSCSSVLHGLMRQKQPINGAGFSDSVSAFTSGLRQKTYMFFRSIPSLRDFPNYELLFIGETNSDVAVAAD